MTEDFQDHGDPETGTGRGSPVPAAAALLAVAVAAAVAAVLMLKSCGPEEPVVVTEPPAAPAPPPPPAPPDPSADLMPAVTGREEKAAPPPPAPPPAEPVLQADPAPALPPLDESNELALKLLRDCIVRDLPALPSDAGSLIRLFVVVVDNMAEGLSPRPHLGFIGFRDPYPVMEKEGRIYADPEGYRRYDGIARLFGGLDAGACAASYGSLKPLVGEAYRDLGYPDRSFDDTLARAMRRVTDIEIPGEGILLLKGEGAYHYEDPALEKLSSLERQIVRMGPENGRAVQGALRSLAAALGLK